VTSSGNEPASQSRQIQKHSGVKGRSADSAHGGLLVGSFKFKLMVRMSRKTQSVRVVMESEGAP
jgi:hypothetical protein